MESKKESEKFSTSYELLKTYSDILTQQQYKTLLGQMKSGDIEGSLKGLQKLIRRKNGYAINKIEV